MNTTVDWSRVTQKYAMCVSLDFIDTLQSTFNTIIKTHFCCDKMATILIENMSALVQIMVWCRTGDKPLSVPMMTQFADAFMRYPVSMS